MKTILADLLALEPFDVLYDKTFYLKLVKQHGIRTDRLSVNQVLRRTEEQARICERMENTIDMQMESVIEEAIQLHPLSIPVLAAAANFAPEPTLSLLLGLAMRQVAQRPTARAREKAEWEELVALDTVGIDFIVDSIAAMGEYNWLPPLLAEATYASYDVYAQMARQIMLATVGARHGDAPFAFDMAQHMTQDTPDDLLQLERQVFAAADAFAQHGNDAHFQRLASRIKSHAAEETEIALDLAAEIGLTIPHFHEAIAPYLIERDEPATQRRDLGLSPTGNVVRDLHRHAARQDFATDEDYISFMQSFIGKVVPPIPFDQLTPEEQVEDLVDEAMQLDPQNAMNSLRGLTSAYEESPLPWLALAQLSDVAEEKTAFAEEGLKRCGKFEDADYVKEHEGHYWGVMETRPYMLLLQLRMMGMLHYGRTDDAIATGERMLRLNTSDNLGARLILLPLYLRSDAPDAMSRADALMSRFDDSPREAFFTWAKVLYYFLKGKKYETNALDWCMRAITLHPYAAATICRASGQPMKSSISPRNTEEVLDQDVVNFIALPAWRRHPEAVAWMRTMAEDMMGNTTLN